MNAFIERTLQLNMNTTQLRKSFHSQERRYWLWNKKIRTLWEIRCIGFRGK